MIIVFILVYFLPIIVVASLDQAVANGMILLTIGVVPIINFIADTKEGKMGLWAIWVLVYYAIAAKMLMERLGYSLSG
jgi:hypothetical protein